MNASKFSEIKDICSGMDRKVKLKPGRDVSVLRGHPWIFSGGIADSGDAKAGDWVEVYNHKNEFVAAGHWSDGSIAVRILSRIPVQPDTDFFIARLRESYLLRTELGFGLKSDTNAYRLVHGEGDGLPGLIIDMYADCAVIQAHSHGMYQCISYISEALIRILGKELRCIYSKSRNSLHDPNIEDTFYLGDATETIATENGIPFYVNWVEGQKTGFFLDQRENRKLVGTYSKDKTVLNTFSYSGGFSMYALQHGATEVCSVDVSSKATELAQRNEKLLPQIIGTHEAVTADVLQFLQEDNRMWDMVILDPPAFAKNLKKKHSAVMGYKRLNALGMKRVKPGGLLFTFSCSQVIDTELFTNTVTAAGIEAGRNARIIHRLTQGPDHPVSLYHPEGSYLKGLVLRLD